MSKLSKHVLALGLSALCVLWVPNGTLAAAPMASKTSGAAASGSNNQRQAGPRVANRPRQPAKTTRKTKTTKAADAYAGHDGMREWAAEVARRRELPAAWVTSALATARRLPTVQRLIMPPPAGVAKDWSAYRARFVETDRIAAGVAFARSQERWLQLAQERWGVPPAIVLGIIGVETYYGRIMGGFRVLDALATLSFDFPVGRSDRSPFFRDELEHLLVWSHRESIEPSSVLGSYAGAIGLGQFMPSSILRYAVDFDGDGKVDMGRSPADVIGSVARYLSDHGWQAAMPARYAVQIPDDAQALQRLLAPDIQPTFDAGQLAAEGARLDRAGMSHIGLMALVKLENGERAEPTYLAGTANFYAITRYNRSSYYALAVIELGEAVAEALR